MKIWLADLTHTGQTIASDTVPAAIGMIGEFVRSQWSGSVDIRLFKFPDDLGRAFDEDCPDVIGFGNYVWNARLALAAARVIKDKHPHVITVMGGPNFPTVSEEQERWLALHPWVDYVILKEGELAFLRLLEQLVKAGFDRRRAETGFVPNLLSLDADGRLAASANAERVMDLTAVPSPYISGRLDEFLDGRLLPVVQTNRGCPFSCAFCTEGQTYWSKVRRKSADTVRAEILYIADHMNRLPLEKRRHDLLIADSNFGMFAEDLDTCRVIAEVQTAAGYPRYLNVATGKNKKERVLEAARIVNGAMKLAGSVQSLDPEVQANMKRTNISAQEIVDLALKAGEVGANTYSEVILALPGDSKRAHFDTLKTLVDADFSTIAQYQLMILPGTEFGLDATKEKYRMELRYRVLPRGFGSYRLLGETINVAEIEEICVANATLPYEDYLDCRRMNLVVAVFYNESVFGEVLRLLRWHGLSPWEFMLRINERSRDGRFGELVQAFIAETEGELWDDRETLRRFADTEEAIGRYISGELGSNLMFKYKALSMTAYFPAICAVAEEAVRAMLADHPGLPAPLQTVLEEAITFKRCQIEGIFDGAGECEGTFAFDIPKIGDSPRPLALDDLRLPTPRSLVFSHTDEQKRIIDSYLELFGNSLPGLTRILSRVFLKQLLRGPSPA